MRNRYKGLMLSLLSLVNGQSLAGGIINRTKLEFDITFVKGDARETERVKGGKAILKEGSFDSIEIKAVSPERDFKRVLQPQGLPYVIIDWVPKWQNPKTEEESFER